MKATLIAMALVASAHSVDAAKLKPETLSAWNRYVAATEARIDSELASADGFLVSDFLPPPTREALRAKLRSGEVFTEKLETAGADGRRLDVPKGLVHHWLGGVLIPNADVDDLVAWLKEYDNHHRYFDEVTTSRLVSQSDDEFEIFLRLRRKKVVTVHYNTEHRVRYRDHGDGAISSVSYATRIAELEAAGSASERERLPGKDRGFLWRLHSYWRFSQTPEGVVVELETVSLSRGIPAAVRWLVSSYLDSVPRESLEATLGPIRRFAPRPLAAEATGR